MRGKVVALILGFLLATPLSASLIVISFIAGMVLGACGFAALNQ